MLNRVGINGGREIQPKLFIDSKRLPLAYPIGAQITHLMAITHVLDGFETA